MKKLWLVVILSVAAAVPGLMPAQTTGRTEVLLEAAKKKELVSGDLDAAIRQYRDIVAKYPANRAVAAEALLRMGQCYEKLGDARAQNAYERVVREFGDQKQFLDEARRLLAQLGGGAKSGGSTTVSQERVWSNVAVAGLNLAPSPDGDFIVYVGRDGNLRYRDLASGSDRAITADAQNNAPATAVAFSPRVSPDGKLVAYGWIMGSRAAGLRIIGVDGSGMREIKDGAGVPIAWSRDGRIIMLGRLTGFSSGEIVLIPAVGGTSTVLASGFGIGATQNAFSPDGRFIVYHRPEGPAKDTNAIWIMNADGSAATRIVADPTGSWGAQDAMWTPDGRSIVFTSNRSGKRALWWLPMADGNPRGSPEMVASNCEGMSFWFMTQAGSLFYTVRTPNRDVYVADFDPATLKVTSAPRRLNQQYVGEINGRNVDWAPDGRSVVYTRSPVGDNGGFIVHSVDTGEERQVKPATAAGFPLQLRYFPDGGSVLTFDYANQGTSLRRTDVQTGKATTEFHLPGPTQVVFFQPALSPDGRTLFYSASEPSIVSAGRSRLVRRSLESGEETNLAELNTAGPGLGSVAVSPDGKQVAFVNVVDPKNGLWLMIVPSDGGPARRLYQGAAMAEGTAWTKDSRHMLFVKAGSPGSMQLYAMPIEGGVPQPVGISTDGGFALSPDNTRIAFLAGGQPRTDLWLFRNLLREPVKR